MRTEWYPDFFGDAGSNEDIKDFIGHVCLIHYRFFKPGLFYVDRLWYSMGVIHVKRYSDFRQTMKIHKIHSIKRISDVEEMLFKLEYDL